MSLADPETVTAARSWRARAADAAVADAGRDGDAATITTARRLVDRGVAGAGLAIATLGVFGGIAGWTTTAELLRPADAPVHAPALLLIVAGTPWLLLGLRGLALLALRRRALPILGRLVPATLSAAIARQRPSGIDTTLSTAIARRVGSVLANGSGRRVAAAGSGVFWTAFATAAILTIWLVTARVALGFGWESSWLPPRLGQTITDLAAAPLAPIIGAEELHPVAPPPGAPADDAIALAARRAWIRFLSAGIAIYLLVPMLAWTMFNAAFGHWLAERWRPSVAGISPTIRKTTTIARDPSPVRSADANAAPTVRDGACTHVVRLERRLEAPTLPTPLDTLVDLGDLDTAESMATVIAAVSLPSARPIVATWLPATPDRGVRRRLAELATAAAHPPVVLLDGGADLRRRESATNAALRLADWRALVRDLGLPAIEVDLGHLTDESRAILDRTIHGNHEPAIVPDAAPAAFDAIRLDEALAAIGRALDDDPPLPDDTAHALAAREIAACFAGTDAAGRLAAWTTRLSAWRDLDASDARARITALSTAGLDLVPARLRSGAVWSALGGVLGATACLAAASIAPAALVALPGWAGTGAGIAGLLSLTRRGRTADVTAHADPATTPESGSLSDRVPALATLAVLLWSQSGDEARTARLLDAVLPTDALPDLPDADAARRWIATMRRRVVAATDSESSP